VHLLPDGQRAVYGRRLGGERDIFVISLASDAEPEPLQATRFNERSLALSPDGRWLAYVSDESGTEAVYLREVLGGGGRVRVSPGVGREPRWGPGGRALYYRSSDSVLVIAVTPGEVPSTGAPRLAWTGTYVTEVGRPAWDVSPNGGRFVFTRPEEGPNRRLNVVLHWFGSDARRDP
jgi:eukaryotic-like serine/threonine-protein kinase